MLIHIEHHQQYMQYKFQQNLNKILLGIQYDQLMQFLNKILLLMLLMYYYIQYKHHLINSIHLYMMYDNKLKDKLRHLQYKEYNYYL